MSRTTIVVDDDRRVGDDFFIEGCWGTCAAQLDEAFYDDRPDADNDLEKGRIKFPTGKLYGREEELEKMQGFFREVKDTSSARIVLLGGYSGVGKSAVIAELVRKIKEQQGADHVFLAYGKYSKLQSAAVPFSALSESLGQLAAELTKPDNKALLQKIRHKLYEDDTDKVVLTAFPSIAPLFGTDEESTRRELAAPNINEVKQAFKTCMNCICGCLDGPLIWFVDDCQWSDQASLLLLKEFLSSRELSHLLFIAAYRSNEVNVDHPFQKLMNRVEESSSVTSRVDLFDLSLGDIGEFLSDTLGKDDADEVSTLAEAVYTKTLGNIFFVKQALEELVRKNALFYDMITFSWEYNLTKVELGNYLSDDVIEMIQSKIDGQPQEIKKLVVLMSFIPNDVSLSTMGALLECEGVDSSRVEKLTKHSVKQGLILYQIETHKCAFAHDKIREASFNIIPKGRPRDQLLGRISNVLIDLASSKSGNEWALFVAVDHLNAQTFKLIKWIELSRLNLRVGKMNLAKGATFSANASFLTSLECLEVSGQKWREYQFTLQLLNQAIISEFSLGNFETSHRRVEDVLENAISLQEKSTAYLYRMKALGEGGNRDYEAGIVEGLKICELYGHKFPNPPKKSDLMKESTQLRASLRNRPLTVLADLSLTKDPSVFLLLIDLIRYASYSGHQDLAAIIADRSIQLALKKGLSKELMYILTMRAASMVKDPRNLKAANKYAFAACQLSQVFRKDKALYSETQFELTCMVFVLLRPFRECLDSVLDSYKPLLNAGRTDSALGSAAVYAYLYLLAGIPLDCHVFEQKLVLFGETANRLHLPTFGVLVNGPRQVVLNLRKGDKDSTELKGDAFDEDAFLHSVDGNAQSTSLRDTSTYRLFLAFVFCDKECMLKMLGILSKFTDPDISPVRTCLRLGFIGLAGFQVGQKKLANKCFGYFKSLMRFGSPNAAPFYHFMEALASPSRARYDKAISICKEGRLLHLAAMANERCGIFLSQLADQGSKQYIVDAYLLYNEWGALSKVKNMNEQHSFLEEATGGYRTAHSMPT